MTTYICYTHRKTGAGFEPSFLYDDLNDLQNVLRQAGGVGLYCIVAVDEDDVEKLTHSGMTIMAAGANYKDMHDTARLGHCTLWEAPQLEPGTPYYVVTRGAPAAVPGFYELVTFENGRLAATP